MKEYGKIRAYFPIIELPEKILLGSFKDRGYILKNKDDVLKTSPVLNKVYNLLVESDPIGRIGTYKGVFNLTQGLECFTVGEGSNSPDGKIGETPFVNVFIFETFFDPENVNDEHINIFIEKLTEIHPYEIPVIEVIDKNGLRIWEK